MRATLVFLAIVAAVSASAQTGSNGPSSPNSAAVSPTPPPPATPPLAHTTPLAGSDPGSGAPTPTSPTVISPGGETALSLDIGYGIRYVPPSRVTVPAGEQVRITAPSAGGPVLWQKDGKALAGSTTNPLVLPLVSSSDAGTYNATYTDTSMAGRGTQSLILSVGPTSRFVNISTRGWVGGADQPFIAGFVVTAQNATSDKKVIVRAIGPSLAKFGVANALPKPTITIYDSSGREYTVFYGYTAVVGSLTPETDLANSLARCGAFPTDPKAGDVTQLRPFMAGSYTVHVGSADNSSGTVLVEVYEVP